MLKTGQSEKHWTGMAFMKGWLRKSPFSPKEYGSMSSGINILCTDETRVENFGHHARCHVWRKPQHSTSYTSCQTVKHYGEGVMIWACFAFTGTGKLVIIEITVNNIPSVQKLKLGDAMGRWAQTHQQVKIWITKEDKKSCCLKGQVKIQTSTPMRCCGRILTGLCISEWA